MSKIIESTDNLLSKYSKILELFDNKKYDKNELVRIFERTISFVKYNHDTYETEHKIAAVFVMTKLYTECKEFNTANIEDILKKFFTHIDNEYKKYVDSLSLIKNKFDADLTFYYDFIKKEKGN